ncbi:Imm5 family immunity protein [Cellulophaga baltica]|uniref:Imm5 family immunity protein n=1 Tax=Cellulophaga baltica TaxID=76594 RepID=UPI000535EB38|nr:Imm5 family immunity protein [Cellulophaga baltica]AIY14022.1 hypothetical protein M667_12875 [Cellulophaga baltica NN016038]
MNLSQYVENYTQLIYQRKMISGYKKIIEKSSNSHLPLKYRVEIAKTLGVKSINKVFIECCKRAYLKFKINDDFINEGLFLTEEFLYNDKKVDFKKVINKYRNYFETIDSQPTSGIMLSVLSLLNNLGYDAALILDIENYEGEDDNEFDWEEWNPDFLLSNLYSGGNPFLNEGDKKKRKEFWFNYLDIISSIKQNPNEIFTSIKLKKVDFNEEEIIKRNIAPDLKDIIENKLKSVIELVKKDIKDNPKWDKIQIEGEVLKTGKSMRAYYFKGSDKQKIPLTFFLHSGEKSSVFLMEQLKDIMYKQETRNGAWLSYHIEVKNDDSFSYIFNYDLIKSLPEPKQQPDNFIAEFESYPRSKEYTPEWWRKLLKNSKTSFIK